MNPATRTYGIALAAAGILAISLTNPSNAFPALTHAAVAPSAMPDLVTDVRYRAQGHVRSHGGRYYGRGQGSRYYGRGYGGRYYGRGYGRYNGYGYGYGVAAATGVIIGAAAVNGGYYGYAPAYYNSGSCWIATGYRGQGYYGPCY
jgi:hypothetical protein